MRFDASMRDHWRQVGGAWRFDLPEGWTQGRSVFGGLTVAAAAALGHRPVDPQYTLRSASASLLRPTAPGTLEGRAELLRQGKNSAFVEVRILQEGALTGVVNLLFARRRDGGVEVDGPRWSLGVDPEGLPDLPHIPGVTPEFVKNVHMRWATGAPPFSGHDEAAFAGYCKYRDPAGDAEGMLGLLDFWPCPSLSLLKAPAPASTVTWTAHLLDVPEDFEGWFGFEYETVAGHGGWHTVVGRLYGPDGRLVGWTEQLAAVFD